MRFFFLISQWLLSMLIWIVAMFFVSNLHAQSGLDRFRRKVANKYADNTLREILTKADTLALVEYLKQDVSNVNATTNRVIGEDGTIMSQSLLHNAINNCLRGELEPDVIGVIFRYNPDLDVLYDGKPAVYVLLDYIATHPRSQCYNAERILDFFLKNKGFNPNKTYGHLPPVLPYLLRQNYSFLGERYSVDYISESVISGLLEAGALVNSYNKGESLLSFAMDIGSKPLQQMLISKGVDLNSLDRNGQTALERAIEEGNLDIYRQVMPVSKPLKLSSLQVNWDKVYQNPEMEGVLAKHLAKTSDSYEELMLFRKIFPKYIYEIKEAYELLAKRELANLNHVHELRDWERRYPDLKEFTSSKLKEMYSEDVARLQAQKKKALTLMQSWMHRFNFNESEYNDFSSIPVPDWGNLELPEYFIREYIERLSYDPLKYETEARALNALVSLRKALVQVSPGQFYSGLSFFGFAELVRPTFHTDTVKALNDLYKQAIEACQFGSRLSDYKAYFDHLLPLVQRKEHSFREHVKRDLAVYEERSDSYDDGVRSRQAREEGERREKRREEEIQKETDRLEGCLVDVKRTVYPKVDAVSVNINSLGIVYLRNGKSYYWLKKKDGTCVLNPSLLGLDEVYFGSLSEMYRYIEQNCKEGR